MKITTFFGIVLSFLISSAESSTDIEEFVDTGESSNKGKIFIFLC